MVGNQIGNLTHGLSFSHNLCFKYPNESCEPIINIYVLRNFQWYKKPFNPMGFDPWNHSLKIWESIRTPTPKMETHLGVCRFIPSHSLTLPHSHIPKSMKCDSHASLLPCTFASHYLGREHKIRVTNRFLNQS